VANVISANTTDHPTLTQVLCWTPRGLFDFRAAQVAGSTTQTNVAVKQAVLAVVGPGNKRALRET